MYPHVIFSNVPVPGQQDQIMTLGLRDDDAVEGIAVVDWKTRGVDEVHGQHFENFNSCSLQPKDRIVRPRELADRLLYFSFPYAGGADEELILSVLQHIKEVSVEGWVAVEEPDGHMNVDQQPHFVNFSGKISLSLKDFSISRSISAHSSSVGSGARSFHAPNK